MNVELQSDKAVPSGGRALRIGLLLHSGHEHTRRVALGAVEYQRRNPQVQVIGDGFNPLISWEHLDKFNGDGLVAIANSLPELEKLKSLDLPFVLAGGRFIRNDLFVVASDNHAIGELAAEHLVSCGLRRFCYIGPASWDDERLRLEGVRAGLAQAGFECSHEEIADASEKKIDASDYGQDAVSKIASMLEKLRPPCGIFCPNSFIGRAVTMACAIAGLKVPDEVAVIAVNDDPVLCETSDPPLSTVAQASTDIGYNAARMLFHLLNCDHAPGPHRMLKPRGLSVRRSTDLLMVSDETVEKALRFMRDNCQDPIEISSIAEELGISRRTLELKFRNALEKTPRQELLRMRLDIAKSLLAESDIPITEIALRSGFGSSQVFSSVFKKNVGVTPTAYRGHARSEYSREL